MKEALKEFIKGIGYVLSYHFPYKLYLECKRLKKFLFSGYIKRQFKSTGADFSVASPLYLVGGQYIKIGSNFETGPGLRIEAHDRFGNQAFNPEILIGNNVQFNHDCHVGCTTRVVIGDNALIASRVMILDHSHGEASAQALLLSPATRPLVNKGEIIIGNNVWIGEGVLVMPGVTIGDNCIIGGNAVVTKSFGPNCVLGGIPAKVIRVLE